jgi:hypothetical protein
MAQRFRVLQSLWAMERRRADEAEWPLQTQLAMIRDAGFDGAGVRFVDPAFANEVTILPAPARNDLAGAVSDLCR